MKELLENIIEQMKKQNDTLSEIESDLRQIKNYRKGW